MKKILSALLCAVLCLSCLAGCTGHSDTPTETTQNTLPQTTNPQTIATAPAGDAYEIPAGAKSITLSDSGITLNGKAVGTDNGVDVFTSNDIIYYEDKLTYESGNPYGEGTASERHSADEAAAHTVVNITAPGVYRVSGTLSQGQLRVDLGEDADEDPNAIVTLILDNADITCTVAPAILFLNVYECDGDWDADTATADVDTTAAGANLMTADGSINHINGSHVAKIFKDKDGEKKLWKQDGAIYSYMSMNMGGSGTLELTADNEGLGTELHLTINSGKINIRSGNDGINTNEDGVSVTTINGGDLHIIAGLGQEGDGIDSNGYLMINGGNVVSSANPASDAGLDSDLGSYINGGTVIALGSTMDWAESDSDQVTMNLQFAAYQDSGSAIVVKDMEGSFVFAYDPSADEVLGENVRRYMGAVVSCPGFTQGSSYQLYIGDALTGTEESGIYTSIESYENGVLQAYTGTDVTTRPGGFGGGMGGDRGNRGDWGNFDGERPTMPEGEMPTMPDGEMPTMPEGENGWQNMPRPDDMQPPEGMEIPEGTIPEGVEFPEGGFGGDWSGFPGGMGQGDMNAAGNLNTVFYMQDKVNCFSGITAAQ